MTAAFPLQWPLGWKRTPAAHRRHAKFAKVHTHHHPQIGAWRHLVAWIGGMDALSPTRVPGYAMRTYLGRPSSSIRFSTSAAMAMCGRPPRCKEKMEDQHTLKFRSWPALPFGRSLTRSTNAISILTYWNGESWLGTSRTRPAATSPLSPASARSQPRRLPPRCPIHRLSGTVANWRHGWGWCHGNIRAAARTA